jgi:hypothetical protein
MARFEVREVFRLPQRSRFVFAGDIVDGTVSAGMTAHVWLDGHAFCDLRVEAIEYLDRITTHDSLVCLVFPEETKEQSEFYADLCPLGTIIEVKDAVGENRDSHFSSP